MDATFSDGSSYVGYYYRGLRHGYGTDTKTDGSAYVGIIGMVDYVNFTKKFSFDYTSVDIGQDVLKVLRVIPGRR